MNKLSGKKEIVYFLLYLISIILLVASSCLPFVNVHGKNLFLVHLFNPTSHSFNGEIESIYGFILPIFAMISLVVDFFNFKQHEYKKNVFNLGFKAALLVCFVFTIMNYFRVLYPNGFIVSGDVSILLLGFYCFVFFLIFYFIIVVLNGNELYHIRRANFSKIALNYDRKQRKFYTVIEVFSCVAFFCFFSLVFVPFVRNYQNYMVEPGFEGVLDKRSSIDYYIFAMFDSDFNLNIISLVLIYLNVFIPTTLLLIPKKTTYIELLITSIFNIILFTIALSIAIDNISLITQKIYLTIDPISLFFIILNLASSIVLIVFTSLLLNYRRKDLKNVVANSDSI